VSCIAIHLSDVDGPDEAQPDNHYAEHQRYDKKRGGEHKFHHRAAALP
jgi:hypothetical protein